MRLLNRRILALAAAVALAGSAFSLGACNGGAGGKVDSDDMTQGNAKAPVTVVEYASVACPHCASFNNDVFPAFKTKYIDTGKVLYVSREMLTGNPQVAAAGFLLARCAGKDRYFAVTDAVYHAQSEIYSDGTENAPDARAILLRIARQAGLSESAFDKCVSDDAALNALNDRSTRYVTKDKIESTPTFVINGKQLPPGEVTLAQLDKAIAEAAKK